ncbi:aspartic proteinase nepenthesin-2 [Ziziphus jujuba]|uniref:Aspartic proteinase nepenthesin-2 n=1 Tax=Ziziphus jujuba TaxID=326968 RepID=A0A6P4ACA9_ZIZJJ|nr:aspartic proteinase nepenthesin-2 [Ziziphus jujuba]
MALNQILLTLFLHLLTLTLVCSNTSKPTGLSLKLIPRDSPDSPLYPGKLPEVERIQRMVEFSKVRAKYFGSLFGQNSTMNPENINLPVHKYNFFFGVQVFLGTPKKSKTLLMDTGSSLVWTQCKPCIRCFNQTDPIFEPTASSTYRKLPCGHPLCRQRFQCINGECVHNKTYSSGALIKGLVSLETFTFPSNNRTLIPIRNIAFGCANDNENFMPQSRSFSGILGLSPGPDSLITQLGNLTRNRFSYCLAYAFRPMSQNSVLRFGEDIPNVPNLKRTPLLQTYRSFHYQLNLVDISVAGNRLNFPPGTFSLRQNGSGGCYIDSGSTLSFITREPYGVVMRAFERHFLPFGLQRVHNSSEGLELCYRQKVGFHQYAGLTFHFQDADLVVQPKCMYVHNNRLRYFCVALAPAMATVVGAWQQQDTRFIYDLNMQQLQFAPEDCSRDVRGFKS